MLFGFPIVNNIMQESMIMWFPKDNQRVQLYYKLNTYIALWTKYSKNNDVVNFEIY